MVSDRLDSRLAHLLKKIRTKKGFTVRHLAQLAGLTPSTIYRIEAHEQRPSFFVVMQISRALDIDASGLLIALESGEEDILISSVNRKPSEKIRNSSLIQPDQVDTLLELLGRLLKSKD